MPSVLIVADDLTGALDSAAMLAGRGMRTMVARRPDRIGEALAERPEVLAVATATREASEAAAADAVRSVLAALADVRPGLVFKKIDSRLKGHVAAETRSLGEGFGRSRALVSPAIPDFGRFVRSGAIMGAGIDAPIAIAPRFKDFSAGLTVPDVATDADLDAAVAGWLNDGEDFFVGARGLAAALGRALKPVAARPLFRPLDRPLLLAVGSRDPITLAQLDRLLSEPHIAVLDAPNGALDEGFAGSAPVSVARMVAGCEPVSAIEAGRGFCRGVAEIVKAAPPASLFACGGETADALFAELDIGAFELHGELMPGVPISTASLGGRPITLVTKSGGFGESDALLRLVEAFETQTA